MQTGLGYSSTVLTANTAGTQIGVVGADRANAAGAAALSGDLHSVTISADSTAETLSIYDGSSTSDTLVAQIKAVANVAFNAVLDLQLKKGLFVVLSGGTTIAVTLTYK